MWIIVDKNVELIATFFILFPIVLSVFYIFYKEKKRTVKIIDKWIKKSDSHWREPEYYKGYLVVYCNNRGKSKREQIAYCLGYIYDDLKVGNTYLILKKYKTIKKVYKQIKEDV
jgi:hypothetical protein